MNDREIVKAVLEGWFDAPINEHSHLFSAALAAYHKAVRPLPVMTRMKGFYDKKLWDRCVERDNPPYFGKVLVPDPLPINWPGRSPKIDHWFSQGMGEGWRIYAFGNKFSLDVFLHQVPGAVQCDKEGQDI